MKIKDNNKIRFNLILGQINSDLGKFFDEYNGFKNCILNICNYWNTNNLEAIFPQLDISICKNKEDVIKFIRINSSEDIQPFPTIIIKTYDDYIDNYKNIHSKISYFYNDLSNNLFFTYLVKIKDILEN